MEDISQPLAAQGPGDLLREARQGYNWTVEDVAANLNLTVAAVQALESGDHAGLPGPTFVRGYLRAYARLMEISEDEVLGTANDTGPGQIGSVVPVMSGEALREKMSKKGLWISRRQSRNWRRPLLLTVLVLAAILATWWFSGLRPSAVNNILDSGNQGTSSTITIPLNTND